jgi:probable HAF family extracellular repeat protein
MEMLWQPCSAGTTLRRRRRCAALVLFAALGLSSLCDSVLAARYSFTSLGTLEPDKWYATSSPDDINNAGQIVGAATTEEGWRGFFWDGGEMRAMAAGISGDEFRPAGINLAGHVAGNSVSPFHPPRAALWDGKTVTLLSHGEANPIALDINQSGLIAGNIQLRGRTVAAVWNGSSVRYLRGLTAQDFSNAAAINRSGQVAGRSRAAPLEIHAFVWIDRKPVDLGTLSDAAAGTRGLYSEAFGLNDTGQVVGTSATDGNDDFHAVLWNGTTAIDLGEGEARDINNAGHAVGSSAGHAMLWKGSAGTDLNSLLDAKAVRAGWHLVDATAINDRGWIVGNAVNSVTGERHGYVLSIPEPATLALALAGLGIVAGAVRLRRSR